MNSWFVPTATVAGFGVTLTVIAVDPPPPPGEFEPPPQPALNAPTNATLNAATENFATAPAKIVAAPQKFRQRRCFCPRTMALLQLLVSLGFRSKLRGLEGRVPSVLHIIVAEHLRQLRCSPLLSVPVVHAAVGNRDYHRTTALRFQSRPSTLPKRSGECQRGVALRSKRPVKAKLRRSTYEKRWRM